MTTPNLSLPELAPSQSQPHVTLNAALRYLDALVQLTVESISNTPPGSPVDGACYIVGSSPTGAWVGREHAVAAYIGTDWYFWTPGIGWKAFVRDLALDHVYGTGSPLGWEELSSGAGSGALLVDQVTPANPSSGNIEIFSLKVGNLGVPMFLTPFNEPFPLTMFSDGLKKWYVQSDGNAYFNMYAAASTTGTLVANPGSMTGSNLVEFQPSTRLTSAASANASSASRWSSRANLGMYRNYTSNADVGGGFVRLRCAYSNALSTAKHFYGLSAVDGNLNFGSGVDPSAALNLIGVGKDEGDTNLYFIHNDGSGTATKVDTGVAASALTASVFDVYIQLARNGDAKIALHDLESGTAYSATLSSDLPADGTLLFPKMQTGNGATASAVVLYAMSVSMLNQIGVS